MVAVFPKFNLLLIYLYMQMLFFIFCDNQEFGRETWRKETARKT